MSAARGCPLILKVLLICHDVLNDEELKWRQWLTGRKVWMLLRQLCASPLAVESCCITITPTVLSLVNRALFLSQNPRDPKLQILSFHTLHLFFFLSPQAPLTATFFLRRRRRSPSCDRHSWPGGGDIVHYQNVKLSIWERRIWFRSVEALLATCNCTCILNLVSDKRSPQRRNRSYSREVRQHGQIYCNWFYILWWAG